MATCMVASVLPAAATAAHEPLVLPCALAAGTAALPVAGTELRGPLGKEKRMPPTTQVRTGWRCCGAGLLEDAPSASHDERGPAGQLGHDALAPAAPGEDDFALVRASAASRMLGPRGAPTPSRDEPHDLTMAKIN